MAPWTARLLPLLALLLMGQDYGSGAAHVGGTWGSPPSGGAPGPGLTIMHQMDFEDSTEGVCADGATADTCVVASSEPDCESGTDQCPINGTYSGRVNNGGESLFGDEGAADKTTGFVTIDFKWNAATFTGASGHDVMQTVTAAGTNVGCRMIAAGTAPTDVLARAGSGTNGTTFEIVVDTDYFARLTYEITTDICVLRMSTSNYGASDVGISTADGATATDVGGWEVLTSSSARTWVVDDIMLCEGDAGTTEGICGSS